MKKLKLKYKIRRIVAGILLCGVAYAIGLGINVFHNPPLSDVEYICEEYTVGKDEVFWNIANRYIDSTKSKWEYIEACEKINGKKLGNIQAGEVIKVITNY
jgi:hypothetical protein